MICWNVSAVISSEQRFGPFKLLVRLGHGGMGEVWKALGPGPSDPGEPLVVKRVLPHLLSDVEMARSFAREARLSENLRHPNIVQVYGSGQVDDVPYLSMEYLHGVDLHHLLWRVREGGLATPPAFAA